MFLNSELSVQMAFIAVHDCKERDYNSCYHDEHRRLTAFARNTMAPPKPNVAHEKAYTSTITRSATGNIDT